MRSPAFATDARRWTAVRARDPAAAGKFYYAVKTTGVYCRPGCASRRPQRANVEFFTAAAAAERAGYRPCKRCRPDVAAARARHADAIAHACRALERADPDPTLKQLATAAGLSPWHFKRLFTRTVGVSPKKYAAAKRLERLRARLTSEASITQAIFAAGFGSSARAYAQLPGRLGMTPSTYRAGAAGVAIRFAVARCALGWAIVAATERGICAIELGDDPAALRRSVQKRFPQARLESADTDFAAVVKQVIGAIDTPGTVLDLPLDIQGSAFQQRVWDALRAIPVGATASYGEIARRIRQPNAVRAVAAACAANKLAVVIPCHRVIRGDGALSGYRWGASRKRALLARERDKR